MVMAREDVQPPLLTLGRFYGFFLGASWQPYRLEGSVESPKKNLNMGRSAWRAVWASPHGLGLAAGRNTQALAFACSTGTPVAVIGSATTLSWAEHLDTRRILCFGIRPLDYDRAGVIFPLYVLRG